MSAARPLRRAVLAGSFVLALATTAGAGSRVIVSATLNSTLQFFDSDDFRELQPPLPSRGGGPVRLWVQRFGVKKFLFAANHGAAGGSVGVFDLGGPLVTELPLSPFPARAGSVGISAGNVKVGSQSVPMAFITNTVFALGGCGLPNGSVTAYDASLLEGAGLLTEIGTVEVSAPIPYAVSVSEKDGLAFVSTNCGGTLDTITVSPGPFAYYGAPGAAGYSVAAGPSRPVGAGPDATLFDQDRGRSYTVNIGDGSVSVYDATSGTALTTVPLVSPVPGKSSGPIDANFGETPGGHSILVTSNGGDDSVSVIDRDVIEDCIAKQEASCARAELAHVPTAVPSGAPEGIDYDPVTNRIFTVNKNVLKPTLSVIQITEDPVTHVLSGEDIARIPITLAGQTPAPLSSAPALIAFDVVVEKP